MEKTGVSLNLLTANEYLLFNNEFEQYKTAATHLLCSKRAIIKENDLLDGETKDITALLNLYPDRFISLGNQQWVDLWSNVFILPGDFQYDLFVAYFLRQSDLMEISKRLSMLNYENDSGFCIFLSTVILKHSTLFSKEHITLIEQWLSNHRNAPLKKNLKGRPKRHQGDSFTTLNQPQTVLLLHYLQKGQVIFRGEYLNKTQAGEAFELLTGFSATTIRQSLNRDELETILTKENLTILYNTFARLGIIIEKDLKQLIKK